ncbi:MAG TPA: hypothetical protein VFT74_05940, partial [Isosphaeraceae bacterium]|nr:hypothetical protein [Isosphaeraceae bacterium]
KWELENIRPIRPGVTLTLTGRIADKYLRNGREFVVYEVEAHDPTGTSVFRTRRTHVLDLAGSKAPREGRGIDSGIKQERI